METAFIVAIVLLILFSLLAFFDGVYLHLFKYKLYEHQESKFEHLTHTFRAFLFVGILILMFINIENNSFFLTGLAFAIVDVIILGIDAYAEKDSRKFMGGLPRWEYIIHLFVNGFHFAGIAAVLILKIDFSDSGIILREGFYRFQNYEIFRLISLNILPGAILISLLHVLVYLPKFNSIISRIQLKCC